MKRRNFIQNTGIIGAGLLSNISSVSASDNTQSKSKLEPMVISTWNHGLAANEAAWKLIEKGEKAYIAAEAGVSVTESDATNQSVGLSGLPDRDGFVTLDACIMDHNGNAGSVCFVQGVAHPIQVARRVMEKTPHVMLVGEGAQQFAHSEGFVVEKNKLSVEAAKAWGNWKKTSNYKPVINIENHDTIGLLTVDKDGNFGGVCTTSGLAYKMHGRVGDSPIIGAGLYVDNEIGAATATGLGEVVIKTCGSFLIVELMRQGYSPQKACEEAVRRIIKKNANYKDLQVGFIAVNKKGKIGACAIHKGFNYALYRNGENKMIDAEYLNK